MGTIFNVEALRVKKDEFENLLGDISKLFVLGIETNHGFTITQFLEENGSKAGTLIYESGIYKLPFPDNHFDLVVSENLISDANHVEGYLKNPHEWFFPEVLRISNHYLSNDFTVKLSDLKKAGFVDTKKIISDVFLYGKKPQ